MKQTVQAVQTARAAQTPRTTPRLLYYAHDHGSGHVRHAANAAATGAFAVTVATAHPRAAALVPEGTALVSLPSDVVPGHAQPGDAPLHYTPTGPVLRDRFAALLAAAQRSAAEAVVVDVSIETALFLRLAGYPVLHRRMHGERTDPAHELVYAQADHLVAHYGAALEDPGWRARFGARTSYLGAPDHHGRLGRTAFPTAAPGSTARITVVTGTGGGVARAGLARVADQVPWAQLDVCGPVEDADGAVSPGGSAEPKPPNLTLHGWVDDVAARMAASDVVLVSAGQNAVVEAARSLRPIVLAAEERPFDEHGHFARAAHAATGIPWLRWTDPDADWEAAVRGALDNPASADRLAEVLLTEPGEYRRRWADAVAAALEAAS